MKLVLSALLLMPLFAQAEAYWSKGDYACTAWGPGGLVMMKYEDATGKLSITNGLVTSEVKGEAIYYSPGQSESLPWTRIWGEKTLPYLTEIYFMPPVFGKSDLNNGRPVTLYGTAYIPISAAVANPIMALPFSGGSALPIVPLRLGGIPLYNLKCIASFENSDTTKRPQASCAKPLTGQK